MSDWIDRFAGLAPLDPAVKRTLAERSQTVRLPKGTVVFGPGTTPDNMLLVLEGTVRVQQHSEDGHDIVLYRVQPGESCVLTTSCLLAHEDYTAEGLTETDVVAAAIPRSVFDELIARSVGFRNYVFTAYSKRITDLFLTIEEIAFQRMDLRLAQKLLELDPGDGRIVTTHQQLAAELGTAREVISRQLAEFQRRDWVQVSRGLVRILQPDALRRRAESA
ncbi:MAG: Crp/Fnr family transcriptional regulator [Rhodospirillales bacterium]